MNFIKRIFFRKSEIEIPKWFFALGIILCVVGFVNASYLTIEHFTSDAIFCPFDGGYVNCDLVNSSLYSEIFNIPVALLGVLYYISVFGFFVILNKTKKKVLFHWLSFLTFLGFLFSVWLTYAQIGLLKAVCTYCLLSAFVSACLFVLDIVFCCKVIKKKKMSTKDRLKKFFSQDPEVVISWQDELSSAQGWVVMNSLFGGAAGGGTRMNETCSLAEVTELAKTMEIKFTVSGPMIGGGKSGIKYDFKDDKEKKEILKRWFDYVQRELKSRYGTGGDQNVDFKMDVTPILSDLNIQHPQEGIVRGMYPDLEEEQCQEIISNLNNGVLLPIVSDSLLKDIDLRIADISTGYGVVSSLKRFHELKKDTLKDKKVIVEGFGNVGSAAAYFVSKLGAKVVGIIDKDWYVFDESGIDVANFLKKRYTGDIIKDLEVVKKNIETLLEYPKADIFIPAATSHTIDNDMLSLLKQIGVSVIASGANNPFVDREIEELADNEFSVIPEFIVNCGMARCFAYFMQPDCKMEEMSVLQDIDNCIAVAVEEIFAKNDSLVGLTNTAFGIALDKIDSRK